MLFINIHRRQNNLRNSQTKYFPDSFTIGKTQNDYFANFISSNAAAICVVCNIFKSFKLFSRCLVFAYCSNFEPFKNLLYLLFTVHNEALTCAKLHATMGLYGSFSFICDLLNSQACIVVSLKPLILTNDLLSCDKINHTNKSYGNQ